MKKITLLAGIFLCSSTLLSGCATESSQSIDVAPTTIKARQPSKGKIIVAVGKFDNRSNFMHGLFTDGIDRLGNQSKTLLISDLQQSNYFNVLDRANLNELSQEASFSKKTQSIKGANYIITGDITEFGRKEVGDHQLWGILGKGKRQIAYAKITLNMINVKTSEVIYSSQGAGQYNLSTREIIGFGGTSSYDSTLNGKVLDLALRDAVNHLIDKLENDHFTDNVR